MYSSRMMRSFNNIIAFGNPFIKPVFAAFPYDNTIYYQWSQTGTYEIYVRATDSSSNTAKSNIVTIDVTNTPTHLECNSSDQCVAVSGAGMDLCLTNEDCIDHFPSCQINEFSINGKTNENQDPLIVFVKTKLKGHFSVTDACRKCVVTSDDAWGNPPQTYLLTTEKSSDTEFTINNVGTYSYVLQCQGSYPEDIDVDTLSLQTVKAMNLPFWREIIPNLQGFLRGLFQR